MVDASGTPKWQAVQAYALGVGSNRALSRALPPRAIVERAMAELAADGDVHLLARSPVMRSRPVGPSLRDYANAAAVIETALPPAALLSRIQALERRWGRRRARRWGERTLDIDILLWSGGGVATRALLIPHRHIRARAFVLEPLALIAPDWPVAASGRRVRHLAAILRRRKAAAAVDPARPGD